VDYLTSDSLRAGALLVIECGFRDVQGEPVLEEVRTKDLPPVIKSLPLERFDVVHGYRPDGNSGTSDTIIDPIRAGAWILIKK
jgi:hypothetical protein